MIVDQQRPAGRLLMASADPSDRASDLKWSPDPRLTVTLPVCVACLIHRVCDFQMEYLVGISRFLLECACGLRDKILEMFRIDRYDGSGLRAVLQEHFENASIMDGVVCFGRNSAGFGE